MKDKEKDQIEKDAFKGSAMAEDRPSDRENKKGIGQLYVQPAVVDEIGYHIDTYKKGIIDVDDMIQAIEEILYGRVKAPGQRFEEQQKTQLNTVENLIIRHLKGIYSNAYPDDFYQSFADQLMNNAEAGLVDLDGLDVESEFDNFAADNRDSVSLREMLD
jgi:hypothetical protein